jgi:anaerobic selenocysteine-containing dehydrogenase
MGIKRAATDGRTHWNYRVVRTLWPNAVSYEIHEAYYAEDGRIRAITQHNSSPFGNSPDEIARDIQLMRNATNLPVIDRNTLKEVEEV